MSDVTRLIEVAAVGDPVAAADLLPLVYDGLRKLAGARMAAEAPGHTLNATALVHEAYLRLVGDQHFDGRGHFFAAAAEAMRRILIEHGRARSRLKRGGLGRMRVPLNTIRDVAQLAGGGEGDDHAEQIVALDDAFRRLEMHDARFADVIRLRFYAGLSVAETAQVLGVSERTVNVDWTYARAWLARDLKQLDAS